MCVVLKMPITINDTSFKIKLCPSLHSFYNMKMGQWIKATFVRKRMNNERTEEEKNRRKKCIYRYVFLCPYALVARARLFTFHLFKRENIYSVLSVLKFKKAQNNLNNCTLNCQYVCYFHTISIDTLIQAPQKSEVLEK